jgi:hypothetical protein
VGIEIEFPLDRAGRAMEPSQIQRSLFEDSVCQIPSARLELVMIGSVHVVLIGCAISSSSFRRFRFQRISDLLRESFLDDVCFDVSPSQALRDRSFTLNRSVRLSSEKRD